MTNRKLSTASFTEQVKAFNALYGLTVGTKPSYPLALQKKEALLKRLYSLHTTLSDEIDEVGELIANVRSGASEEDTLTELADWLGDIQVYCASEMLKFGLDNTTVLSIIMASNMSKLDEDGNPIYNADGKVMKGPNYWKPEPMIKEYIKLERS